MLRILLSDLRLEVGMLLAWDSGYFDGAPDCERPTLFGAIHNHPKDKLGPTM